MKLEATYHAYVRARQRFSWSKSTLDRMMEKAYRSGLKQRDCKSQLKKYLGQKQNLHTGTTGYVYGENVYFFTRPKNKPPKLITIYRIPTDLIKYIKLSNKDT